MKDLINKVVKFLAEDENNKPASETLKSIETEFVDVREAFELGRALQSVYERLDDDEIGEVIEYVQNNITQRKY